jgi:hypothetical protein
MNDYQHPPILPYIKHELSPSIMPHKVIRILDSDEDETLRTGFKPNFGTNFQPSQPNINATCPSNLAPYTDWQQELNVRNSKGKKNASPGNKSQLGNMPLSSSHKGAS